MRRRNPLDPDASLSRARGGMGFAGRQTGHGMRLIFLMRIPFPCGQKSRRFTSSSGKGVYPDETASSLPNA